MDKTTQLLISEFADEAIQDGDDVYFKVADAPRVVEFLRDRRMVILGFDGIRMEGGALVPDMELIADFSGAKQPDWQARVDACADVAQRVLADWPSEPHLVVEFVVAEPAT